MLARKVVLDPRGKGVRSSGTKHNGSGFCRALAFLPLLTLLKRVTTTTQAEEVLTSTAEPRTLSTPLSARHVIQRELHRKESKPRRSPSASSTVGGPKNARWVASWGGNS